MLFYTCRRFHIIALIITIASYLFLSSSSSPWIAFAAAATDLDISSCDDFPLTASSSAPLGRVLIRDINNCDIVIANTVVSRIEFRGTNFTNTSFRIENISCKFMSSRKICIDFKTPLLELRNITLRNISLHHERNAADGTVAIAVFWDRIEMSTSTTSSSWSSLVGITAENLSIDDVVCVSVTARCPVHALMFLDPIENISFFNVENISLRRIEIRGSITIETSRVAAVVFGHSVTARGSNAFSSSLLRMHGCHMSTITVTHDTYSAQVYCLYSARDVHGFSDVSLVDLVINDVNATSSTGSFSSVGAVTFQRNVTGTSISSSSFVLSNCRANSIKAVSSGAYSRIFCLHAVGLFAGFETLDVSDSSVSHVYASATNSVADVSFVIFMDSMVSTWSSSSSRTETTSSSFSVNNITVENAELHGLAGNAYAVRLRYGISDLYSLSVANVAVSRILIVVVERVIRTFDRGTAIITSLYGTGYAMSATISLRNISILEVSASVPVLVRVSAASFEFVRANSFSLSNASISQLSGDIASAITISGLAVESSIFPLVVSSSSSPSTTSFVLENVHIDSFTISRSSIVVVDAFNTGRIGNFTKVTVQSSTVRNISFNQQYESFRLLQWSSPIGSASISTAVANLIENCDEILFSNLSTSDVRVASRIGFSLVGNVLIGPSVFVADDFLVKLALGGSIPPFFGASDIKEKIELRNLRTSSVVLSSSDTKDTSFSFVSNLLITGEFKSSLTSPSAHTLVISALDFSLDNILIDAISTTGSVLLGAVEFSMVKFTHGGGITSLTLDAISMTDIKVAPASSTVISKTAPVISCAALNFYNSSTISDSSINSIAVRATKMTDIVFENFAIVSPAITLCVVSLLYFDQQMELSRRLELSSSSLSVSINTVASSQIFLLNLPRLSPSSKTSVESSSLFIDQNNPCTVPASCSLIRVDHHNLADENSQILLTNNTFDSLNTASSSFVSTSLNGHAPLLFLSDAAPASSLAFRSNVFLTPLSEEVSFLFFAVHLHRRHSLSSSPPLVLLASFYNSSWSISCDNKIQTDILRFFFTQYSQPLRNANILQGPECIPRTRSDTRTVTLVDDNAEDELVSTNDLVLLTSTNALQGVGIAASAAAAAVVPSLAFGVARQQAVLNFVQNIRSSNCAGVKAIDGVPAADSPTQMSIGESESRNYVGGVAGNFLLCFLLFVFGEAGGALFLWKSKSSSWNKPFAVFARCNVALILFVCSSLLLAPTLKFGLVALTQSDVTIGEKILVGIFSLLGFGIPTFYYAVWSLYLRSNTKLEQYRKVPREGKAKNASTLKKLLTCWFEGEGEWMIPPKATLEEKLQFDAATPIIEGYNKRAKWFGLAEFIVMLGLALAPFSGNLSPVEKSCVTQFVVLLVVLSGYLFVCVCFRPFQELFNQIAVPFVTACELAVISIAYAFAKNPPPFVSSLAVFTSSLQSLMAVIVLLASLSPLTRHIVRAWKRFSRKVNNKSNKGGSSNSTKHHHQQGMSLRDLLNDGEGEELKIVNSSEKKKDSSRHDNNTTRSSQKHDQKQDSGARTKSSHQKRDSDHKENHHSSSSRHRSDRTRDANRNSSRSRIDDNNQHQSPRHDEKHRSHQSRGRRGDNDDDDDDDGNHDKFRARRSNELSRGRRHEETRGAANERRNHASSTSRNEDERRRTTTVRPPSSGPDHSRSHHHHREPHGEKLDERNRRSDSERKDLHYNNSTKTCAAAPAAASAATKARNPSSTDKDRQNSSHRRVSSNAAPRTSSNQANHHHQQSSSKRQQSLSSAKPRARSSHDNEI